MFDVIIEAATMAVGGERVAYMNSFSWYASLSSQMRTFLEWAAGLILTGWLEWVNPRLKILYMPDQ